MLLLVPTKGQSTELTCKKFFKMSSFLPDKAYHSEGNWIPSEDGGGGCEKESNFCQLMLLRANDDPGMLEIMKRKTNKYTDHHIQDEVIKLLAHSHLRRITADIKAAGYFAVEADEVTDSSNKEQVVVCIRWVDDKFEAHEDFVGLHACNYCICVSVQYDYLHKRNI